MVLPSFLNFANFMVKSHVMWDWLFDPNLAHSELTSSRAFSSLVFQHCSGGMSCNNAQLITQNVSEVVTHYTRCYTAKNRKKCLNHTKIHKFQG